MTRKSLILLAVVAALALIAGSALAVMAQDDGDDPAPAGPGWMHGPNSSRGMMHGRGMMGGGFGGHMMWDGDGAPMMLAVAEALGLEPDAFYAALRDGQSLTEIAESQGVELQTVYDAMLAHGEERMAQRVEAGIITQAQAEEHLAWMRENIAQMPMVTGEGFGHCMGGMAGVGHGMMGSGHGMRWNRS